MLLVLEMSAKLLFADLERFLTTMAIRHGAHTRHNNGVFIATYSRIVLK